MRNLTSSGTARESGGDANADKGLAAAHGRWRGSGLRWRERENAGAVRLWAGYWRRVATRDAGEGEGVGGRRLGVGEKTNTNPQRLVPAFLEGFSPQRRAWPRRRAVAQSLTHGPTDPQGLMSVTVRRPGTA